MIDTLKEVYQNTANSLSRELFVNLLKKIVLW
jgi:hypothetical protein